MILVTGSPRSGTSMWMQILREAGLPVLGDAFPQAFEHLTEANPAGFYESRLRNGIFFGTNPDPRTGQYLHPDATRRHVLKVFVPGLVRTDHAFLDRVIATVRPWREFTRSFDRLRDLERDEAEDRLTKGNASAEKRAEVLQAMAERRARWPGPIAWWFDVYELVRDAGTRRYPMHVVAYPRLLEDPRAEIGQVLEWIGEGNLDRAVRAVRPELRNQQSPEVDVEGLLDPAQVAVMDAVLERLSGAGSLDRELIAQMNALHKRISAEWKRPASAAAEAGTASDS